jgi:polyphosphate kinase 2 (PPK2 family)
MARNKKTQKSKKSAKAAKRSDGSADARGVKAGVGQSELLSNKEYAKILRDLHVELVRLQEWVKHAGLKVCVIFEGRDGAGKGGTIKAITERVSPRVFRVVHSALSAAFAGRRGDRHLRPQLVQPRRRGTRDGILHGGAGEALSRGHAVG